MKLEGLQYLGRLLLFGFSPGSTYEIRNAEVSFSHCRHDLLFGTFFSTFLCERGLVEFTFDLLSSKSSKVEFSHHFYVQLMRTTLSLFFPFFFFIFLNKYIDFLKGEDLFNFFATNTKLLLVNVIENEI